MDTSLEALRAEDWKQTMARGVAEDWGEYWSEGWDKGWAKAKFENFLMLATSKYGSVPEDRQAQVRTASKQQIDTWLCRILTASSINAVFDDDTDSDPALNEVTARSPRRKRVAS